MSMNSSSATRIPGRRERYASAGRRSKPGSTRYLYDDDNESSLSLEESVGDVSGLLGFAMAPCADDESEITNKMHNLSSIKYGRKFPKHHSGYRQYQEQQWRRAKRVRFQDDDATPISALTEDAVACMHYNDSMRYQDAHALSDEESDVEYPTNVSHSSETRSTADSSFDDEEEQVRLMVHGESSSCDDESRDVDICSIGNLSQTKRPLLIRCLPSTGTMSRWFFLLGCILTLWMAIDALSWAKEQERLRQEDSSLPTQFQTRLRRKLATGKAFTHQQQWNGNSNWEQLQKDQQEQWSTLGYTEEKWDNHDGVSSENIDWDKLSSDQQESAQELGFTKTVWDHFNTNETSSSGETQSALQNVLPSGNPYPGISPTTEEPETASPPVAATTTPAPTPAAATAPPSPAPTSSMSFNVKDPVVFTVGSISITKCMVLSFASALCFSMVGIMEWIQHDFLFQLLLAIAGVWGLLSAMFVHRNPGSSIAFHTLSAHCFLGSAVAILWLRCRQPSVPAPSRSRRVANRTQEDVLLLADLCFAVGAAMAVVSSYLTLSYGVEQASLLVDIQRFDVFGAILWVACAVIYLSFTYKSRSQEC